jgi:hypothetical protein
MEFLQAQNWARGRMSSGSASRDRSAFVDHIATVLARNGSGVATKGSRPVLANIVKSMKANAMMMDEWNIPHNLNESVEIQKKPVAPPLT